MADLKYLYKNFRLWFTVKFCGKFFNLNYILNVLAYERYCDYAFYRNNCPLIAVITGMERSGTTLLSQLLNGHPRIKAGVECGVLLSDVYNFNKIKPFYDWMVARDDVNDWGWNISGADRKRLLTAQGYDEFYWLLNKFKGTAHKNESIRRKFIAADLIFDKTPRYVYFLSSIMARTPYKFIVTLKDPYEQYMSTKKYSRTGHVDLKVYKKQYLSAYNEIVRSLECFPDRIKVVKYYDLITDPESCMWNIKQFLGLQDDIELSLDQYNRELGELFMTKSALNRLNSFHSKQILYHDPKEQLSEEELTAIAEAFQNSEYSS